MRYMIRPSVVLFVVIVGATVLFAGGPDPPYLLPVRTGPTASDNGDIHVPAGQAVSSFPWTTTDLHGFQWDIVNNGAVSDGSNDAYDGGMQLQVGGTAFPAQPTARLSADGKEIEIGWRYNNLNISRRIFVNTRSGYCRWIDIFENTTGAEITVALRYYSNVGDTTSRTHTTSGSAVVTSKDWGIVTAGAEGSNRPAVVHVFATPAGKFKPVFSFTQNNDNLYCDASIKVPPSKAVALCFFEAQRKSFDEGVGFLKNFNPAEELLLVPAPLRKIVLNMTEGGLTAIGGIELKRDKKSDLIVLINDNEIRGEIINKEYVIRADFGQVTIPADAVIGLAGQSSANDRVRVVMADGQVIAGELTGGPVAIKLADGTELKIAPKELLQAAYRISPEKPEKITASDSLAVFRSRTMLAFDSAGVDLTFQTPYGVIKPSIGDLRAIEMDTPAGGLHQIVFHNGSTLAGLMTAERIRLKLKLGSASLTEGDPTLEVSCRQIKRFLFPARPVKPMNLVGLTFRNADVIFGLFADEKLTVHGKIGPVTVLCREVAKAEFNVAALGQVKLTMRDGTELAGKLADDYIKFKIEPGPELKIFTGHIESITGAAEAESPAEPSPTSAQTDSRVTCPKCGKSFIPKAEAVTGGIVKVVCPYCGTDLSNVHKGHIPIR